MKFKINKVPTKSQLLVRLQEFNEEYIKQYLKILEKLKIASGTNKKRIANFKKDVEKLKERADKLKQLLEKKGIRGKLSTTKFYAIDANRYMLTTIKFLSKYKKEDCDIKNFKV